MTAGVGTIEELSNIITGAPFEINGDPNTYAWTGTPGASPSTETTPAAAVRTNLIPNPSFEDGIDGWTAAAAAAAQDDEWCESGSESVKVTADGSSAESYTAAALELQAGHTYTVSATIRLDAVQTGAASARARSISVWDSALAHVFDSAQAANAAAQARLSVTFTPATTGTYTVRLYNGSPTAGEAVWWDDVLLEEAAAAGAYFDGDSAGFTGSITAPTGTFTEIASIDTATEFDQIVLTRDSNPGVLAYEDPHGVLQIFDADTYRGDQ